MNGTSPRTVSCGTPIFDNTFKLLKVCTDYRRVLIFANNVNVKVASRFFLLYLYIIYQKYMNILWRLHFSMSHYTIFHNKSCKPHTGVKRSNVVHFFVRALESNRAHINRTQSVSKKATYIRFSLSYAGHNNLRKWYPRTIH